jgi:hypothetical protein
MLGPSRALKVGARFWTSDVIDHEITHLSDCATASSKRGRGGCIVITGSWVEGKAQSCSSGCCKLGTANGIEMELAERSPASKDSTHFRSALPNKMENLGAQVAGIPLRQ